MSTAKLIGILTNVFPIETSPKFSKKLFWLREPDSERYPNHWELELHQQDTSRLQGMAIGDRLECEVEIRGRKWAVRGEDKIFHTIKCVGIKVLSAIEVSAKYKPREKPGRENEDDRSRPQLDLPL